LVEEYFTPSINLAPTYGNQLEEFLKLLSTDLSLMLKNPSVS